MSAPSKQVHASSPQAAKSVLASKLFRFGASVALVGGLAFGALASSSSEAAATTVGDKGFKISIASAGASPGQPGSASISITPQPGWHLNVDFPTKISLAAPADVTLPKSKLAKADAKQFGEQGFEFPVNFTASTTGTKKIVAKLKFAICTEDACQPVTKNVTISVKVAKASGKTKTKRSRKRSKKS